MTLPEEASKSKSTATSVTFNPAIPRVTSISGYWLESNGWVKFGLTWEKGGEVITYDGSQFRYKNQVVTFIEEIK